MSTMLKPIVDIFVRRLRNNHINGTLDMGTSPSNRLQLVDLQDNFIERFDTSRYDKTLMYGFDLI